MPRELALLVVDPLKRRMQWETKRVESFLRGISLTLDTELESVRDDVLKRIDRLEESLEDLARELARQKDSTTDDSAVSKR